MKHQSFSLLTDPSDPLAAVTHADLYSYYARLADERPFYHDKQLACWVAASAQAVRAVLESGSCRVRPPAEPVPTALLDSDAGAIFRHLIRMHDRAGRCQLKRSVSAALDSLDEPRGCDSEWISNSAAAAYLIARRRSFACPISAKCSFDDRRRFRGVAKKRVQGRLPCNRRASRHSVEAR